MAKQRTFGGITGGVWSCVKTTSEQEHGTVYAPPGANQGTATTNTIVGEVILSFDFDPAKESVAYSITKKPFLASDNQIWDGIQETIDHCNGS
ncbi:MAG: hypothetical protein ACE5Q6_02190 [Dehalococcoidia bacterium]